MHMRMKIKKKGDGWRCADFTITDDTNRGELTRLDVRCWKLGVIHIGTEVLPLCPPRCIVLQGRLDCLRLVSYSTKHIFTRLMPWLGWRSCQYEGIFLTLFYTNMTCSWMPSIFGVMLGAAGFGRRLWWESQYISRCSSAA